MSDPTPDTPEAIAASMQMMAPLMGFLNAATQRVTLGDEIEAAAKGAAVCERLERDGRS